jgi:hypothetical protein
MGNGRTHYLCVLAILFAAGCAGSSSSKTIEGDATRWESQSVAIAWPYQDIPETHTGTSDSDTTKSTAIASSSDAATTKPQKTKAELRAQVDRDLTWYGVACMVGAVALWGLIAYGRFKHIPIISSLPTYTAYLLAGVGGACVALAQVPDIAWTVIAIGGAGLGLFILWNSWRHNHQASV